MLRSLKSKGYFPMEYLQLIQYSNFVLLFRESPKSVYFTLEIILY